MRTAMFFAGLMIAGSLSLTPGGSALAGQGYGTIETYSGAHRYARELARKIRDQEIGYRASERRRLAKHGYPEPWHYYSPLAPVRDDWGCYCREFAW